MRWARAAAGLLALAACDAGPPEGAGRAAPSGESAADGAFVRVGGLPIPYSEVRDLARHYRGAQPAASANEIERLALTAYLIPRTAFAALAPEAREQAREKAAARLAELRGEPGAAPAEPGVRGSLADSAARIAPPIWRALDELYAEAAPLEPVGPAPFEEADTNDPFQALEPSPWVGPLEDTGNFAVVRLVGVVPGPPRGYEFEYEAFYFRDYEGGRNDYFEQVFSAGLELVDPLARELVPRHWQLEMGASD